MDTLNTQQLLDNKCSFAQAFAANANDSYALGGLKGHTGVDWHCGFGTDILSDFDGYVYKVLTPALPANDGSGFTGVFMIVNDGIELFEWLVGHCNPTVTEGMYVRKGDKIGTEANHGTVFEGGVQITLAMQQAGDQRGAHRHYQKRPVVKSKTTTGQCLTNHQGGAYYDGNYYNIPWYSNGFNGCVDPTIPQETITPTTPYSPGILQWLIKWFLALKNPPPKT